MSVDSEAVRAQLYLDANRPRDAIQILSKHLASNPEDLQALRMLASAYLTADSSTRAGELALTAIEPVLAANGSDDGAWRILVEIRVRLGQFDLARDAAQTAQSLESHSFVNHLAVVRADVAALAITRTTRAALKEALRIAPGEPAAYNAAGSVARADGRLGRASNYYRRALAINPGDRVAAHNLALVDAQRGDLGRSVAGLVALVAIDPSYKIAALHIRSVTLAILYVGSLMVLFIDAVVGSFSPLFDGPGASGHPGSMTFRVAGAAVTVVGFAGYALWVRHRAGMYFVRYIRALPSIAPQLVVWFVGLVVGAILIVVAAFVNFEVASAIYSLTGFLIVLVSVASGFANLVRPR